MTPTHDHVFCYKAFGLNIHSPFPLLDLLPGEEAPDVEIGFGTVPDILPAPQIDVQANLGRYQATRGQFLFIIYGVAKFLILDGRQIIIERTSENRESIVRVYTLGSALGALLHQRGLLTLHGSAVNVHGKGVVFLGPSGEGKSTIAATFGHRGYPILTDDVCALSFSQETPLILPGYPQVKLWADAVRKLGQVPESLELVTPEEDKRRLPLKEMFCNDPLVPSHIYFLNRSAVSEFKITPVKSMDALTALINNTYRVEFLEGLDVLGNHFQQCAALAKQVKASHLVRPEIFPVEKLVEYVIDDLLP